MFAYAARDHSKHHGTTVDQYAKVTYKNRRHGAMNDRACFQVCMYVCVPIYVHACIHRISKYVHVCMFTINLF